MQSLTGLNFDTYGYSFSDTGMANGASNGLNQQQQQQRNMMPMLGTNSLPLSGGLVGNGGLIGAGNMQLVNDQGLSPPYSNHSPPHSVQSNVALSPPGCIGKEREYSSITSVC